MKTVAAIAVVAAGLSLAAEAHAGQFQARRTPVPPPQPVVGTDGACSTGAYSVVPSPDGTTLSILFDNFVASPGTPRVSCAVRALLKSPPGYIMTVHSIDYRGFAGLGAGETGRLSVQDSIGPRFGQRGYQQILAGGSVGDFNFHQNLPRSPIANLPRNAFQSVVCGGSSIFTINVALQLDGVRPGSEAQLTLDTADAAPVAGLVYKMELQKC